MKKLLNKVGNWFISSPESGVITVLILFSVVTYLVNPAFLTTTNFLNILRASGFTIIVVTITAMVLIIGGLDLSVGSVYAFSAIMCCFAMTKANLPIWLAIIVGLAIGAIFGTLNGFLIVYCKMPPMIVTLGSQYIARGLVTAFTKGVPVYPLPDAFVAIEPNKLFGFLPIIVVIGVIFAIIGHLILTKTVFGRSIFAIGGNAEAAKISGIKIEKTKMIVYILSGIAAALAGVLMASRLGSGEPSTGVGLEMKVICGSVIGGISIVGGAGTILGALLGAIFMELMTNSLTFMKVSIYYQNVVFGAFLVFSVLLDQFKRNIIRKRSVSAKRVAK